MLRRFALGVHFPHLPVYFLHVLGVHLDVKQRTRQSALPNLGTHSTQTGIKHNKWIVLYRLSLNNQILIYSETSLNWTPSILEFPLYWTWPLVLKSTCSNIKNNPVKSAPLKTEHSVRSRKALVYRGSE